MKKLSFFIRRGFQRLLSGCYRPKNGHGERGAGQKTSSLSPPPEACPKGLAKLVEEILRLLEEQRIYRSPDLDLKYLSERLNTPSYLVTKAINDGIGVNFYDLINRYRVEEVKLLLTSKDCKKRFTLISVAFDAGFNSKTTFNTVFKKFTGLTPSSYRDIHCSRAGQAIVDQDPVCMRSIPKTTNNAVINFSMVR